MFPELMPKIPDASELKMNKTSAGISKPKAESMSMVGMSDLKWMPRELASFHGETTPRFQIDRYNAITGRVPAGIQPTPEYPLENRSVVRRPMPTPAIQATPGATSRISSPIPSAMARVPSRPLRRLIPSTRDSQEKYFPDAF
jgi:hypothetical protein